MLSLLAPLPSPSTSSSSSSTSSLAVQPLSDAALSLSSTHFSGDVSALPELRALVSAVSSPWSSQLRWLRLVATVREVCSPSVLPRLFAGAAWTTLLSHLVLVLHGAATASAAVGEAGEALAVVSEGARLLLLLVRPPQAEVVLAQAVRHPFLAFIATARASATLTMALDATLIDELEARLSPRSQSHGAAWSHSLFSQVASQNT